MSTAESYTPRESMGGVERDESPTLGALAAALAKAQGAMSHASKDKTNPHFRSRYADLASTWEACREALSANGLAVVQTPSNANGGVMLTTLLVHASGEWVRSRFWSPVREQSAQGYGSALTYLRRYSLASLVGVAPDEDDDGNAASGRPPMAAVPPLEAQTVTNAPPQGKRTAEVKAALSARRATIQDVPPEPPPPSDADAPPAFEPSPDSVEPERESADEVLLVPFGKNKGRQLNDPSVPVKDLKYLEHAIGESVADPAKERFKAQNARLLRAIQAELRRRG